MDENVLAAIVRLNEAETFLVVVELYGAHIHKRILSLLGALEPKTRDCATCGSVRRCLEGLNVRLEVSEGETARCPAKCR
jgi:hypothetical protein